MKRSQWIMAQKLQQNPMEAHHFIAGWHYCQRQVTNGKAEHLEILKGLGPERIGEIAAVAELLVPFREKLNITLTAALEEYIGAKTIAGEKSLVTCIEDYLSQPSLPTPEGAASFDVRRSGTSLKKLIGSGLLLITINWEDEASSETNGGFSYTRRS